MTNPNAKNANLVPAICTQCGGQIDVDPSQEKAVCKYCETSFFVETAIQNYDFQITRIEHVESVNIKKRGAVESVLNFVERQQDKKQQKIDEEMRKQEEQRKKVINQIINRKYRKRNLAILGAFFIFILILSFMEGSSENPVEIIKINMPASSSDFEGENYHDVINKLQDAGFTNIKTEIIYDLVFGWLTKDGEVEEVSVDGDTIFSTNSRYPADVEIAVSYHTFLADEEESAESLTLESTEEAEPTESVQPTEETETTESAQPIEETKTAENAQPAEETETAEKAQPTEETETAEKAQPTEETQSSSRDEIITIDNNEEFALVLNTKDPGDQIIKEFAMKYAGRTIEFDGNIAYMSYHEGYTTRYDFLISPWDYSETSVTGPNFQFEDCGVFELHLIGDNVPDAIGMGDNLHFVAKIIKYNETTELFRLEPISTEVR